MKTTEQLLDALARSGLVSASVIASVKQRLLESWDGFAAADVVRWLVMEGHITAGQGERLLASDPKAFDETKSAALDAYEDLEVLPDEEDDDVLPPLPHSAASLPVHDLGDPLELLPSVDEPTARRAPSPEAPPSPAPRRTSGRTWRSEVPSAAPQPAVEPVRDDLFGNLTAGATTAQAPAPLDRTPSQRKKAKRGWDSPLLLYGGGALLLLIILAIALTWANLRGAGDRALAAAVESAKQGSFTQAIQQYDAYLEKYPNHKAVGEARVNQGLLRIRQSVENASNDFRPPLTTAEQTLDDISTVDEFANDAVEGELTALLPEIAKGLAKQTTSDPSQELVDRTRESLKLLDKYLPADDSRAETFANVEASLAVAVRALNRDASLSAAVAQIDKAVAAGTVDAAYASRRQLLRTYPELVANEALLKSLAAVAEAERKAVKFVADPRDGIREARPSAVLASTTFAVRASGTAPGVEGASIVVGARGVAFGLDATTGNVLWRRFVGFDGDPSPQRIGAQPDADTLLADATSGELLRVDSRTGAVKWRQEIAAGFDARPVVLRDRVLVAGRTGRLTSVQLDTGATSGYVQLTGPLDAGPAAGPQGQVYYQPGRHSNLFVISAADGTCVQVVQLGHEPGTIVAPPLVVGRYVFVVENGGAEDGALHVLLADEQGQSLKPVERVAIAGHALVSPIAAGRTLVVATDRGSIDAFEMAQPGETPALKKIADKPAEQADRIVRFPVLRGGELWVGGAGLTKYDIQAARGRLSPKWVKDDREVALAPPELIGKVVFLVRQSSASGGVTVGAVDAADGQPLWQSLIAAPLAGSPAVLSDRNEVVALTVDGALFATPSARFSDTNVQSEPQATMRLAEPLSPRTVTIRSPDGVVTFADAGAANAAMRKQLIVFEAGAAANPLRTVPLPDEMAAAPCGVRNVLFVPGRVGQLFVIDPRTARNLVEPFQPKVEAGQAFTWTSPVPIGAADAVIGDGAGALYRVTPSKVGKLHMEAAAQASLGQPALEVAAVGSAVYVVDAKNQLQSFAVTDLAAGESWPLEGRPAWGPLAAGEFAFVASDDGKLRCLDAARKLAWESTVAGGVLVAPPLTEQGHVFVATASGSVLRLEGSTGKELARAELGEPIAAGPWRVGEQLMVATPDGALLVLAAP